MVVLKIGGTSMGGARRMERALDIAAAQLDRAPLMVCSAMGGITDRIIEAYTLAARGLIGDSEGVLESIRESHRRCADELLGGDIPDSVTSGLEDMFAQFASLLKGVGLLMDSSPRSRDAMLCFGERLSTLLIHARAGQRGIPADLLDSRQLIRTDEAFTAARPDMEATFALTAKRALPAAGRLIITQGFVGSSASGVTTTLGRGGSDYSASILGAALNAEEIQIWTDVDGIMTSDPRIVPQAVTVPEITYAEAGELAFFGAKVVHPAAIQPAVSRGIPVLVKDTGDPRRKGTRIAADAGKPGLKAISAKKGVTLVSITSSRMLEAHGFLRRIFAIFDAAETPVDLVTTSEVSVSMTIDDTGGLSGILEKLETLGEVSVESGQAIICMVGRGLWRDPQFTARAFGALEHMPVRMISLGASEVNLSVVVPESQAEDALKRLHTELFG